MGRSHDWRIRFSKIGAVVGATHKEQGIRLREQMPHTFFLVPGYGAQGATAQDLAGTLIKMDLVPLLIHRGVL
jgi:orotidine-5'-phosphate decarboxylase